MKYIRSTYLMHSCKILHNLIHIVEPEGIKLKFKLKIKLSYAKIIIYLLLELFLLRSPPRNILLETSILRLIIYSILLFQKLIMISLFKYLTNVFVYICKLLQIPLVYLSINRCDSVRYHIVKN